MTKPLEAAFDRAMEKAGFVSRKVRPAPLHSKSCVFVQCQDCNEWVHWCREPGSAPKQGSFGEVVYVTCDRCDTMRPVESWTTNATTPCPARENGA